MSTYLELLEDAHDALHALLDQTNHGQGQVLRLAYRDLERSIDYYRRQETPDPPTLAPAPKRTYPPSWSLRDRANREREVLGILSERCLTVRELTALLNERHGDECTAFQPDVRYVVNRLFKARELDRREANNGARVGYRYSKRTQLDGPIADLERALRQGGDD